MAKMMPGQEPYTPDQERRLQELLEAACEAEELIDIDELEEHSEETRDKDLPVHGG